MIGVGNDYEDYWSRPANLPNEWYWRITHPEYGTHIEIPSDFFHTNEISGLNDIFETFFKGYPKEEITIEKVIVNKNNCILLYVCSLYSGWEGDGWYIALNTENDVSDWHQSENPGGDLNVYRRDQR